jgi:trans-aconitate 2-methyltransferase
MPAAPIWDPQQYLRHAAHRNRPFHDLLARIPELAPAGGGRPVRIADLGCGPGNVTIRLADRWPDACITGFDNSAEMLREAGRLSGPTSGGGRMEFALTDIADWEPAETLDLIVSNAALQWVRGHADSFKAWLDALAPDGVLAFQVPGNFTFSSHALLGELCDSPRWRERLREYGRSYVHVLEASEYLRRLAELGCVVDAWETTYVQLLTGDDPVLDWVKGTALRPVLTVLAEDPEAQDAFLLEYRDRLRETYPRGPHGTVFPFRRIFVIARKTAL